MNRIEKMAAYVAPTVEVIEVIVEKGFAQSVQSGNAPIMQDGYHF